MCQLPEFNLGKVSAVEVEVCVSAGTKENRSPVGHSHKTDNIPTLSWGLLIAGVDVGRAETRMCRDTWSNHLRTYLSVLDSCAKPQIMFKLLSLILSRSKTFHRFTHPRRIWLQNAIWPNNRPDAWLLKILISPHASTLKTSVASCTHRQSRTILVWYPCMKSQQVSATYCNSLPRRSCFLFVGLLQKPLNRFQWNFGEWWDMTQERTRHILEHVWSIGADSRSSFSPYYFFLTWQDRARAHLVTSPHYPLHWH